MKKSHSSIDGFVPRRPRSNLGDRHQPAQTVNGLASRPEHSSMQSRKELGRVTTPLSTIKTDIDESLNEIDAVQPVALGKDHLRPKRKSGRVRRTIKWFLISLLLIGIGLGGYIGVKIFLAEGNVFQGTILDLVQNQPLKEDANGRSNFLILGTSEDDPGHGGAWLTDSIMIVSFDQSKKNAFMFSIPRDLYVKYGKACNSGYMGKINEYFLCSNPDIKSDSAEKERLSMTSAFIGNILGMDLQYVVHVNNTVIKEAVNAVGGVDVNIEGSGGAGGILDRNFDWRCNYKCYLVKYDDGVHHLDGEHALYLAMARGDIAPTYGLGNSNFDREKNQQKIIIALKEKALSTGTLTNLVKVTGLIDALGNNLRTNIPTKEIRTIMSLASDIPAESIYRLNLFDGDEPLFTSGPYNGVSVVMPVAGIFDYSDIRTFLQKKLSSNPLALEGATVVVLNGSGKSGAAQATANELSDLGLDVVLTSNAKDTISKKYEIYAVSDNKKASIAALEEKLGVKSVSGKPSYSVGADADIIVVVGPSGGQ